MSIVVLDGVMEVVGPNPTSGDILTTTVSTVESISLNSFVLLENLAMLLTSTFAINY